MGHESDYDDVRQKSLKSVKWTYGSAILPVIVSPFITVVLAALLGPRVFGVVAIASLIISFVDIVKDSALTRTFVQSEGDERALFDQVFWLSLGYGIGFYLVVLVTAPFIADLFHSRESIPVIRVLGFQMVLSSLCTGHNGILIRSIDFKKKFKIDALPNITPLFVAIPLAYAGMGVWSLVIGYLASSLVRTIVVWHVVPVRPRFEINRKELKRIAIFGFLCSVEALLAWFFVWGDRAIVGHYLDVRLLGIYTFATTIVITAFTVVLAPLTGMSYAVFCRLKDDFTRFTETLRKLMKVAAFVTLPAGVLICASSGIFSALIGKKWSGIETPLGILAIAESFTWTVYFIVSDAVRSRGQADVMPKFQALRLVYTLPMLVIGVKVGGLEGFCYAKLAAASISFFLFLLLLRIILKIRYGDTILNLKVPFVCTVIMAGFLYLGRSVLGAFEMTSPLYTCVLVFFGSLIYVGSASIFDPTLMRSLWRNLVRAM